MGGGSLSRALTVSSGGLPEWGRFGNVGWGLVDLGLVDVCRLCLARCFW